MADKKSLRREKYFKRFGSRKVFFVHTACLAITLATVGISIILTFAAKVHTTEKLVEHIALCVLAVLLLNIPVFMRTKLNYNIPAFIHIIAAVFIIAHCVLGEVYRAYDRSPVFDKLLHTTAGVVIAILGFSIVYGFSRHASRSVRLSPIFVAVFSFCFALALLVLWEVFEYFMDTVFGMNMQRYQDSLYEVVDSDGVTHIATKLKQGSGLSDTMMDMIVGAIGAFVVCVGGCLLLKKYPESTKFYITKKHVIIAGSFVKSERDNDKTEENFADVISAEAVTQPVNLIESTSEKSEETQIVTTEAAATISQKETDKSKKNGDS